MKLLPLASAILAVTANNVMAEENYVPKPSAGSLAVTYFDKAAINNLNGVSNDPEATQLDTHLKLPLGAKGNIDDGLFVFQFNLREREFRIDNADSSSKQRLYDIAFPISYIVKNDNESRWIFNLTPGVKSSLEYFGTDDLSANAVAQYSSSSKGHGYNLGIVYTHRFGEGQFVPLANYQYNSGKTLKVIAGFPFSRLSYAPTPKQHYFAKLTPEGGSWHVYNNGKEDQTFDFQQKGIRFGLGAEFHVGGPVWLGGEAGIQFNQELELDNEQGDKGTLKLDDSKYLQLTAKLRFR